MMANYQQLLRGRTFNQVREDNEAERAYRETPEWTYRNLYRGPLDPPDGVYGRQSPQPLFRARSSK